MTKTTTDYKDNEPPAVPGSMNDEEAPDRQGKLILGAAGDPLSHRS